MNELPSPKRPHRPRRVIDRMAQARIAELQPWHGFCIFLGGTPLPGALGDDASSAWAKVRQHPKQTAAILRDIGYEVYPVTISVRKGR